MIIALGLYDFSQQESDRTVRLGLYFGLEEKIVEFARKKIIKF